MRIRNLAAVCVLAAGAVVALPAAASAAPARPADNCSLKVGFVGYSADMFYVGAWLSGDCHGQVQVDLQQKNAGGGFDTIDSASTYPTDPNAQGGTAWFDDKGGYRGTFRGVGHFGNLTVTGEETTY